NHRGIVSATAQTAARRRRRRRPAPRLAPVTAVEDIAAWVAGLSAADLPADVVDLCRDQRRSVLGAIAASSGDAAARRILDAVGGWAADGPVGTAALGRAVSVDDALYATTALSMALDFDDYVCFGHTGHSAVPVPVP